MSKKAKIAILCINIALIIVLVIILILRHTGTNLPSTQNVTSKLTELPTVATEKNTTETEQKTEESTEPDTENKSKNTGKFEFDDSAFIDAPEIETKEYQPGEIKVGEEYGTKEITKTVFYDKTGFFPAENKQAIWDEAIPLGKAFLKDVFTFSGDKKEYTKRLKAYWYEGDKYGITKNELKQVINLMSYYKAKSEAQDVTVIGCLISDTDDTHTDFTIHLLAYVTADFTFDDNKETPNITIADVFILKEPGKDATISGVNLETTVKKIKRAKVSTDGEVQFQADIDTIIQAWDQKSFTDEALKIIKERSTEEESTEELIDVRTN